MDASSPTPFDAATRQGQFTPTHWSVVMAARQQEDSDASMAALARLCSTYWRPLYAFIRRQGMPPHEAEDMTQGFFEHFLERDALRNVSPAAGKFRSFLLACLKHFLANQRERAQAQRRGGGQRLISLDGSSGETQYLLEPADTLSPDALFERRWAFAVLEQALSRLREEYVCRNQGELFEALKGFLPGGEGELSRPEVATRQGISAGALDVAIHRLRQRFGTCLRVEVSQTVSSNEQVDEELRHLISVLGR
ncbi:MAG TPA: sigma-70 family RNA polymerase sigma factor [Verrucomicrobiae bacterium]|nr:sigma-70 family RNA polymerase sigma factor [Verrucomicrobiae bacterium]